MKKKTLSEVVDDVVHDRPCDGPDYIEGSELLEKALKGQAFPYPLDKLALHYAFEYKDPEMAAQARYKDFIDIVDWLFLKEPNLFAVLERTAISLVLGRTYSATLPSKRSRGRPRNPEKNVDDIAARLSSLRRDDEARRFVRNAASMCIESNAAERRERARQERMPTEEEIAQRHATYFMLRDELERFATGTTLPRLANVLLFMLDEQGVDRSLLVTAAERAGVLKSGRNKRENLANLIGAVRKELDELFFGEVRHAFDCAWWPRKPPQEATSQEDGAGPAAASPVSGTSPAPNDAAADLGTPAVAPDHSGDDTR